MARPNFKARLESRWAEGHFVCLGLDPEASRLPACLAPGGGDAAAVAAAVTRFCMDIVSQTHDLVGAYKPNAAFFEALGPAGGAALAEVVAQIRSVAPEVPVIYDAKRGDIGSTNEGYARHAFDELGADAITVHPYLGEEALRPFLERHDKGIVVLCRTSNPGGGEFQDLPVQDLPAHDLPARDPAMHDLPAGQGSVAATGGAVGGGRRLYEIVAERVATVWNRHGNCSLVVGATVPAELARVRAIVGDMPILVPGIGAQGGDLRKTLEAGRTKHGLGLVVNSSRGIIFASAGEDFAVAARAATAALTAAIAGFLAERA